MPHQGSLENILEKESAEGGLQIPTESAPIGTFVAEITDAVQIFFSGWWNQFTSFTTPILTILGVDGGGGGLRF